LCPNSRCLCATLGSTGISEADPHTANAPLQGSTFITFVKKMSKYFLLTFCFL